MQNDTRIGVDIAKSVFQIAVSERPGRVCRRERLPRPRFLALMAQQPPALVIMEACGSARYWAGASSNSAPRFACFRLTSDAKIGANAVVLSDVPEGATAVGAGSRRRPTWPRPLGVASLERASGSPSAWLPRPSVVVVTLHSHC
jgi:hypothetical protein